MLFYLKYVPHEVEKLHLLLVFFFEKVLQTNPTEFNSSVLFPTWYLDNSRRLLKLESMLSTFFEFSHQVRNEVAYSFIEANKIELYFSDTSLDIPIAKNFADTDQFFWKSINDKNFSVQDFLNELFTDYLYESQLGNADSTFSKKINSNLNNHYQLLLNQNSGDYIEFSVCPFCGLEKMRDEVIIRRPDYDHISPKGKNLMVFSAVNLRNLFPMGSDCNIKKDTSLLLYSDPLLTARTLAFYPYSTDPDPFNFYHFELVCDELPNIDNLFKGVWRVDIVPNVASDLTLKEKIHSWDRVFQIKDRIARRIAKENKAWLSTQILSNNVSLGSLIGAVNDYLNKLKYEYLFISTEEGLIPKRIFFQWLVSDSNFLSSFVPANTTFEQDTYVQLNDTDYE